MKKGLLYLFFAGAVLAVMFSGCASLDEDTSGGKTAAAANTTVAAGSTINLWNFESKTTDGWHGALKWADSCTVNENAKFVKEGKCSMKIDAKGSNGWNQNIAVNDGPFPAQFQKMKAITMDVFVPADSINGLEYGQIFVVISGSANSWYQIPQGLKAGWNSLQYDIDTTNTNGDIWHVYLVFNSGGTFAGPVYIDNVMGKF